MRELFLTELSVNLENGSNSLSKLVKLDVNYDAKSVEFCILGFIKRFKLNLDTIHSLIPAYKLNTEHKLGINLILRSLCSDALTALYLCTFLEPEDSTGFTIEQNVLTREFLISFQKIHQYENDFIKYFNVEGPIKEDYWEKIKREFPEFVTSNNSIKSKAELRGLHNEINRDYLLTDNGAFISEEAKFKRLAHVKLEGYVFFYVLFKYYSLFQHYTPEGHDLIAQEAKNDDFYLSATIDHVYMTAMNLAKMIGFDSTEITGLRAELNILSTKYF